MIPVGGAGKAMRVIPVEAAIPAETKTASYEQLSYWLKKYDFFAVGSCSCRISRRLMGEGCGHLEEDMCIAVGEPAQFAVTGGVMRQITYEECLEVLRKAEDNGLVHQVTNVDGRGQDLRHMQLLPLLLLRLALFAVLQHAQHVPLQLRGEDRRRKVRRLRPVRGILPRQRGQAGSEDRLENPHRPCRKAYCPTTTNGVKRGGTPISATARSTWSPPAPRPARSTARRTSPCRAISSWPPWADTRDALELIRKENPLPAVCGRICNRRCEFECTRGDIDQPIAIDEIKKFIADQELNPATRFIPKKMHDYGKKIAIVGSGPAGLSCAYYLAIDGYDVTVFEKENRLAGC